MKKGLLSVLLVWMSVFFMGSKVQAAGEAIQFTEPTGYYVEFPEGYEEDQKELTLSGTDFSAETIYNAMIALKEQYPEGTRYTNADFYRWKGGYYYGGYGCAGFAFMLSDAAFGDLPARFYYDYSKIRVGDILRVNGDTHSVIVLEVHESYVIVAEGNYNSSVHWGRRITREEINDGSTVHAMTRYPEGQGEAQPIEPDEPPKIYSAQIEEYESYWDDVCCFYVDTKMDVYAPVETRWQLYDETDGSWNLLEDWQDSDGCWIEKTEPGRYLLQAEVRVTGQTEVTTIQKEIYVKLPEYSSVEIKGKCQMPYTGEGGGYLIGVETTSNPGQKLQYELLILDCTLLAEGKPAWIWTTGKCGVQDGNAFWAIWQPQYGYYWTLFRVYDEFGNMLAEQCYGFVNAY